MRTQSQIYMYVGGKEGHQLSLQLARQLVDGGMSGGGEELSTQLCTQCTTAECVSYSDAIHLS